MTGVAPVKSLLPFDVLRVGSAVVKAWKWVLLAALAGGSGLFALGARKFETKYTAQVQVVRREMANTIQATEIGESFKPRQFNAATISAMMRAGSLMEKTGRSLTPPVSASTISQGIVIRPEKNTDLITVAYTSSHSPAATAAAINAYAENVVELTREMQAQEARELLAFVTSQMDRTQTELAAAQKEMMDFSKESGLYNADKETEGYLRQIGELDLKIETARIERETIDYRLTQIEAELARQDPAMQRLKTERDKLAELLSSYTAQHPLYIEQQARVKNLEQKLREPKGDAAAAFQSTGNTVANSLFLDSITLRGQKESLEKQAEKLTAFRDQVRVKLDAIPDKKVREVQLRSRVASLEETKALLAGRQREAELHTSRALGYYRLFAPATAEGVETSSRTMKLALAGLLGALLLGGAVAAWKALRAMLNDTVVSPSDVRRLARAHLIASLPDQSGMDAAALERWRFSAWASLVRHVPAPPDGALVAGLLSGADGEGKSTFLRLLATAALERGLKVLAITPEPSVPGASIPLDTALQAPQQILENIRSARPAAAEIHTGNTWTPEQRSRWRDALAVWSTERELVVLVELPPASRIESLIVAETLPAVLWLSESGRHRREHLTGIMDTIRQSGVRIVGAVLNRIPPVFQKLPDLAKLGLCLAFLANALPAQEPDMQTPPPAENGPLPAVVPSTPEPTPAAEPTPLLPSDTLPPPDSTPTAVAKPAGPVPVAKPPVPLAAWQERLTLGPGDLVNLQVFGKKEYTRTEVPINPDGTITYLQVHGFKAVGLTVDELREGLSKALQAYISNARVIVTPSAYRSKKYFLLGTVIDRGAYTLDRPMTLLEAAARARGIATGLLEQNTVEIADMRRAFIVRDGKKLDVDFTKLFYEGDLAQNIQLQPGDYIYFPSNIVNEVYILGAVDSPGHMGVTESLTALGAISIRGGFGKTAWKKKVLIVRGSLEKEKPEVIEVDAEAVLSGKAKDVVLQPRDLVYVHEKPWQRASEILDLAVKAFIQTGTATWTGKNIGPLIKEPLLPSLNQ